MIDFTDPSVGKEWKAQNDISKVEQTIEGLKITISGLDPYINSPVLQLVTNQPLFVKIILKSHSAGISQIFYFTDFPAEERSVKFFVNGNDQFEEYLVRLPPLPPGSRLRFDPPGYTGNEIIIQKIEFYPIVPLVVPSWPKPETIDTDTTLSLKSGHLELFHSPDKVGGFVFKYQNKTIAIGHSRPIIGYTIGTLVRWLDWNQLAQTKVYKVEATQIADRNWGPTLWISSSLKDPDGGSWLLEEQFIPQASETFLISVNISCDKPRDIVLVPFFLLLYGVDSVGTNKNQALLAGLEYLANEPSSSTADVEAPGAYRKVPESYKITFPLAAINAEGLFLGMSWTPVEEFAVVFDSPDRTFNSGGHLLGIVYPPTQNQNRDGLMLYSSIPIFLPPGKKLTMQLLLFAGRGDSVVSAIQRIITINTLPPLPTPPYTQETYFQLVGTSWLNSKIREGELFRHALWPGFNPQPSSDAAWIMEFIAYSTKDSILKDNLIKVSQAALNMTGQNRLYFSQIGHIPTPLPLLLYAQDLESELISIRSHGYSLLREFAHDGLPRYKVRPGSIDYSRTHWTNHANGLTADITLQILQCGILTGDPFLIKESINTLYRMEQIYHRDIPRGAQTWEIPLHTPDILAAAHLVRAFLLGYVITEELHFLEEAKYWAWTGIPFVYLRNPTDGKIGVYCTIPVYGATSWKAPVWFGLPVQWCGLVYAKALYELYQFDRNPLWKHLADGIVIAGMQMSWPISDHEKVGLLPDVFHLYSQLRDGPAINPATLFIPALDYFATKYYSVKKLPHTPCFIHCPGQIAVNQITTNGFTIHVKPLMNRPYWTIISGCQTKPIIKQLKGAPFISNHYLADLGIIGLRGAEEIEFEIYLP